MATVDNLSEPQLFLDVPRSDTLYPVDKKVCRTLALVAAATPYVVRGSLSCRPGGIFMGATVLQGGNVVKNIAPVRLTRSESASDIFEGVGLVGAVAAQVVQNASSIPDLTATDLFGAYTAGEPPPTLNTVLPDSRFQGANPAEHLWGVCDKLNWLRVNDDNNRRLCLDVVFGPGWLTMGATIRNAVGTVVGTLDHKFLMMPDDARFFRWLGEMLNAAAGNAVQWMRSQM